MAAPSPFGRAHLDAGDQPAEVPVALAVLDEQRQAAARRERHLGADQRGDAEPRARAVEAGRPVEAVPVQRARWPAARAAPPLTPAPRARAVASRKLKALRACSSTNITCDHPDGGQAGRSGPAERPPRSTLLRPSARARFPPGQQTTVFGFDSPAEATAPGRSTAPRPPAPGPRPPPARPGLAVPRTMGQAAARTCAPAAIERLRDVVSMHDRCARGPWVCRQS